MKIPSKPFAQLGCMISLLLLFPCFIQAQFLRSSYLVENSHYRTQLNPSLMPTRGYINLPVIGSFHAHVGSGSLGYRDIIDILNNKSNFYSNPDFLNRLKDDNRLNMNVHTDLISGGWYRGDNFWSFNVSVRTDIGAKLTRSLFTYLNEMDDPAESWRRSQYDIAGQELNINAYTELGMGYARAIDDRLSVGARVKLLFGIGNTELKMEQLKMRTNLPGDVRIDQLTNSEYLSGLDASEIAAIKDEMSSYNSSLLVRSSLKNSFKGLNVIHDPADGLINDLDFDTGDLGIAGFGLGLDLGASYKITNDFTVSVSLLDLGFISWSKSSTEMAQSSIEEQSLSGENYVSGINPDDLQGSIQAIERNASRFRDDAELFIERVKGGKVLNYKLLGLGMSDVEQSRTTRLASTLAVGGEYRLLDNSLGLGILSTTRFLLPKANTELTLSANYRPMDWLDVVLSYSFIQSAGKSFGLALRMGPVFIGSDYMFFGNNTKNASLFAGVSIPLGEK